MFEVLSLVALLQGQAAASAPGAVSAGDRALLSRTDPFARAPASSRARLQVRAAGGKALQVEVWRSGEDALVRFLDERERGKYLLRVPAGTYFIAPGAKQPIRLPPTHRLLGAVAIDELLGIPLATRYEIADARRRDPKKAIVELDLRATAPDAPYARLRWVVDEAAGLPLRADFQFADGRIARVLEWKTWRDREQLLPRTMVVKDVLHQELPAEVEVVEFEARAVPPGLFSLTDPAARSALER